VGAGALAANGAMKVTSAAARRSPGFIKDGDAENMSFERFRPFERAAIEARDANKSYRHTRGCSHRLAHLPHARAEGGGLSVSPVWAEVKHLGSEHPRDPGYDHAPPGNRVRVRSYSCLRLKQLHAFPCARPRPARDT
jgi:hypothetical protein